MRVSVAICTWNRAALLDQTLTRLRALRIPAGVFWELLVVNNRCTDATDAVLARHQPLLPLRRLYEEQQGLSHARNAALRAAQGDLLLFTDDDVLVDPDWLTAHVAAAQRWPDATYFGGPIEPWFEQEPPRWIQENLAALAPTYALLRPDTAERMLVGTEAGSGPYGANMGFRLARMREIAFDPRLGRAGADFLSGDDTEMMRRLTELGHQGVWVGRARVRHFIPAERLTTAFVAQWFRGGGRSAVRLDGPPPGQRLCGWPRWALRQYCQCLLRAWCLTPFKSAAWFRAFSRAAYCRGILEESAS